MLSLAILNQKPYGALDRRFYEIELLQRKKEHTARARIRDGHR